MDLLCKLNRQKKIMIVMVLHDINLYACYADHIFAMNQGELIAQRNPKELITPELIRDVYELECELMNDPVSRSLMIIMKYFKDIKRCLFEHITGNLNWNVLPYRRGFHMKKIDLRNYLSMRIAGTATELIEVNDSRQLIRMLTDIRTAKQKYYVLGGGTNTLHISDTYSGVILRMRIMGISVIEHGIHDTLFEVGAGENMDDVIAYMIQNGYAGMENLSGIPGTVGAAPVQNAGAYGSEIKDVLKYVRAVDTEMLQEVVLDRDAMKLAYRSSIFNSQQRGRYIITAVGIVLKKISEFEKKRVQNRRKEVLAKRAQRVPDHNIYPNCGSYFKNPVISQEKYAQLLKKFPLLKGYPCEDKIKLSAGQLIDLVTEKNELLMGIRVPEVNALILINHSADSYLDLHQAEEEIRRRVQKLFGVELIREVNVFA